ncbi:MAG: ATP synthase F1 subunit delta [Candidatus Omnitrophica bacterium]|nr:ATP synthase F1 subunit delta [Candidatus Omnitrophota bacterium]MCA9443047.1 ATP synthase F1 subunit delta [Candidatus Omnitrophota bacterium]MCB9767739.1 ATP synthase F1 subunit delta [Candidatus Omnitrophota bacterium]
MAQTSVLAQRYGEGLFRVVRETGKYQEVAAELASFLSLIQTSPQVKDLMENPVYGTSERLSFLEGVKEKANFSETTHGLLYVLIERNRIEHLESILQSFEDLYRDELGLVSAEVTVASEIDAAAQAKIKELVHALTQKSPELDIKTDPDIIGGLKIKVGNTILDASLKSKLERMHQALLEPEQASS